MKTFEQWMTQVDAWCERLAGCSYQDLPDVCYADMYEDGIGPKAAARQAIRGED